MGRIIVIGDIHGCLDEFDELITLLEYTSNDRLILAGDLVDRGPDSVGVVRRARELEAECVLGNHEHKHIRWNNWEKKVASGEAKKNPMKFSEDKLEIYRGLNDADFAYLDSLPRIIRIDGARAVVHGGCRPNVTLEQQPKEVTMIRYVHETTGRFVGIRSISDIPENTVYWSEVWTGPETLFYGHAVHDLVDPRLDEHDGYDCWGLDTGCVFGGRLTAAVLNTYDFSVDLVQVQAKCVYSERKPAGHKFE
jgi:predicted phosphodiesterase